MSYITTGLFQGQHKENVIKEFCIPLPFLKEEPFNNRIIKFRMSKDDFKKAKITDHLMGTCENAL